ncbi:MAG: hypothetical protein ACI4QI_04715 [Candidatus Coproplasma sp.]
MLGLQNGGAKGTDKTASPDFSGENTPPPAKAEEQPDRPSARYDCASSLLERHERIVNRVKNKK